MSAVPKLTCLTCRVVFAVPDLHRTHFQSEWHRYNLKRKVAELEPISQELFEDKASAALAAEKQPSADVGARCHHCAKSFASYAQLENHFLSKKHKERAGKADGEEPKTVTKCENAGEAAVAEAESSEESDWTDVSEDGTASAIDNSVDAIRPTDCLFCGEHGADVVANTNHMYAKHGFFVPDLQYCINVHGLIEYLGYKVGVGHECIQCAHPKDYRTVDSVRKHMKDKCHTTLRTDAASMLELDQFYDYAASYPDAEGHTADEDVDEDQLLKYAALDRGWQLQLPSGATVGHRSLARYYRQHLRSAPAVRGRAQDNRSVVDKLMLEYGHGKVAAKPAAGGMLTTAAITREMAQRKARDQKFMHRHLQKHQQQLGVKANKLFVFRGREE